MKKKVIITDSENNVVLCRNCGFKVSNIDGICFVCGAELSPSVPLAMDQIESRTPEANDKPDQAEQDQSVPDDTMEIMRVFGKGHREIVHAEYKDDSSDI